MAKNRPVSDPEIQDRISRAEQEIDAMERVDLAPDKLANLPAGMREVTRDMLNNLRSKVRHQLEATGVRWGTGTVEDVENVAHNIQEINKEFREKITPLYIDEIKKTRRLGHPRTDEERKARHMLLHGTDTLPPRGTGLMQTSETTSETNWGLILLGVGIVVFILYLIARQRYE